MIAFAAPAHADDWYGKVSVGQSEFDVQGIGFEPGTSYGAAVGTSVGFLRVEAGADRISGQLDAGFVSLNAQANVYSLMAYADLPVGDHASIYGGAGIAYVDGEASAFGQTIGAAGEGTQWAVGGAYRFTDRIIGEAQYTQLDADLDADYLGGVDLSGGRFTLGARLALG